MGTLILGCASALVVATAALASSCLRLRSTIGFLLAVHVLATAEIVALSLGLSTVRAITRPVVLAVVVVAFALVLAVWLLSEHPRPRLAPLGHALRDALDDMAVAALAALAVAVHLYLLVVSLALPQSLPDTLLYHLPRAALWKQQHAVAYVLDAPDNRINAFPPVAEIEAMASMVLSEGDRYVGLVQLFALAAACLAIVGIALRLGLSRSAALFGALAFATFTVVALQTPTALNDLVVASLLIVCAYFALGSSRAELALCAAALALSVGTKGTVVFAVPVLVAFVLASQPRSRWWSLAAAGAVGLAAGSFWFVLNLAETGDPGGGTGFDQGLDPVLERIRLSFVDLFELSDAEGTGFLASPLWGLGALAVASTVAAVIAVRGRLRAGGVALLVGVMAFFAAPLVVTWARVADRVLARAGSAGRAYERADDTAAPRLPRVADALFVRAGFRRVARRRRRARRGRRAAEATARWGTRRARGRADRASADGACARVRPPAHALHRLLRRAGRDGARNGASRESSGLDVGCPHGDHAHRLGGVLRSPPGGPRAPLGESQPREVGSLVRPGREWQRGPRGVPLSRRPDPAGGDDRPRRRTQHVPLPCLGRGAATNRRVRPRRRPGARRRRVARGRAISASGRESPRDLRVGAPTLVSGRLANLQSVLRRQLMTLSAA